jgi:hypothetical protein
MTVESDPKCCIQVEPVNQALREHEEGIVDWRHRDLAFQMHGWTERFVLEFKLDTPTPAIRIDRDRGSVLGTYRRGRNGFGLKHEITINTRFLESPFGERLLTLFHELLHQWQDLHGRPGTRNYHNTEFRFKAKEYGLLVDSRGITRVEPGPFTELIASYGVNPDPLFTAGVPMHKRVGDGQSKMRKWSCHCTNVRCAVELKAKCGQCGAVFRESLARW